MGRTDDVINIAGHRLSTGAMEKVLAAHPDMAERAVIGGLDDLKGQRPLGLAGLNKGCTRAQETIRAECIALMRETIGPIADFKQALLVKRRPKTRSGKFLRAVIAKIANGETWSAPRPSTTRQRLTASPPR